MPGRALCFSARARCMIRTLASRSSGIRGPSPKIFSRRGRTLSGERARNTYVTLTWCSKPQPTLDRVTALREANIYEPQRYRHLVSPALMSIGSDATPAAGSSQARPWSSIAVRSTRCWRSRSDCPCRQARARPFGGSAFRSQPLRIRSGAFVPRRQHLPFPRPNITASADCCIAATFSVVMRRHSVGEHVPSWSIIRLRRAIVSRTPSSTRPSSAGARACVGE